VPDGKRVFRCECLDQRQTGFSNLQSLTAAFGPVGEAAGDIRAKLYAINGSAEALRTQTDNFLRDVLAA
jgi:hypothetical protein